jgi:hypothetical protein
MLPSSQTETMTGYYSVYQFSKESAAKFNSSLDEQLIKKDELYSDELILDFDNGSEKANEFCKYLQLNNINYKVYFSGSKGFHIYIKTLPLRGSGIFKIHKQYCKELQLDIDYSLFRANSIITIPGTPHRETKVIKAVVESFEGDLLDLSNVVVPVEPEPIKIDIDTSNLIFRRITRILETPATVGNRHIEMYNTVKDLNSIDLSEGTIRELAEFINNKSDNPLSEERLERAIDQGLKFRNYKTDK